MNCHAGPLSRPLDPYYRLANPSASRPLSVSLATMTIACQSMLRAFLRDERGVSVTEYGLMIATVVLMLMVVVTPFASQIAGFFDALVALLSAG
jgi:Flp pilus assembly pilin Flp